MQKPGKQKWLESIWTFLGAVLLIGPFALPLLWKNPRYSRTTKIAVSVLVTLFTLLLIWGSARLAQLLVDLSPIDQDF
jgi:hypothetical protein